MITKTTPKGWMLSLLSALFMLSGLTACSSTEDSAEDSPKPKPEVPVNDGDWQTVPISGGTITKDSISIDFPSGSFSKDTKIAITTVSKGEIGGNYEVSPFYQLTLPLKIDQPITIKIKCEEKNEDIRFLLEEPCFKKSIGEMDKHSFTVVANYSNGEYSLKLPASKENVDEESYLTIGLCKNLLSSGAKTRIPIEDIFWNKESVIEGKVENIEWYYTAKAVDYLFMTPNTDEFKFMFQIQPKLNKYIEESLKQIRNLHFSIKTARQIPFVFTSKRDSSKPDAYGNFCQSLRGDEYNTIELIIPVLKTKSEKEIKQTIIHELLHYFQADYDPRSCLDRAFYKESTITDEAGSVWIEQFMDNGNMNGDFVAEYLPIYLISSTDLDAAYQGEGKSSKGDKYAKTGYAMSTMLYYLTSPLYPSESFVDNKMKIVELYKLYNKHPGSGYLPLFDWLDYYFPDFFYSSQFDDYLLALLTGNLINHPKININVAYPEGLDRKIVITEPGKKEKKDICYGHGCVSYKFDLNSYIKKQTSQSLKGKRVVIKQIGGDDLATYIIAHGKKGTSELIEQLFQRIDGTIFSNDSLVISGESLDALFGEGNLVSLHALTINHYTQKNDFGISFELQGEEKQEISAKVEPDKVTFEAEGGTNSEVKITKGSYKYCDVDDIATPYNTWLSAKCSADGIVTIEAQPNTATEGREGKVYCWVSNKENPSETDKKYLGPVIVIQKASDGSTLLDRTDLEFPVEGGAKFIGYSFGTYLWMKRDWENDTWLRTAWSKDYLNNISYNPSSDNRFANQLYVCCFPNETGMEREQTITFSYSMIKGFEFDTGDKFPVKIKQEGGSFNMDMMKNFFVGTWYTPQDITFSNGNYYHRRYTFRSDNTFTFEGQTTKSTSKPSSWEVEVNSTYSILSYEVKGECVKVYIKIPGNDGVWYKGLIERWPHFIFFAYENTDGSLRHGVYMEPE